MPLFNPLSPDFQQHSHFLYGNAGALPAKKPEAQAQGAECPQMTPISTEVGPAVPTQKLA